MPAIPTNKVALITGAAHRIGKGIAHILHANNYKVIVHYHQSRQPAEVLVKQFNVIKENSAIALPANLLDLNQLKQLAQNSIKQWGQLDLLVNNASSFYPTPFFTEDEQSEMTEQHWHDLFGTNLKAPYFLSQAIYPALKLAKGNIINIIDIHANKPMKNHSIYCMAKAGLAMMTQSLAKDLAPEVRVNGVCPGAILWPESSFLPNTDNGLVMKNGVQQQILEKTVLKRQGTVEDIAQTVLFLADKAPYITGQMISVDGGRSLNI